MLTKNNIQDYLRSQNIKSSDTVLIHTSLKAIGDLDGGADMIIDSFVEYLKDGLFIIPTHTWSNVNETNPFFDVKKTTPCIGVLPTIACNRKDGIRSLHPTHSIVAFGKRAKEYVKGEEKATTPAPIGGCWQRLYDERAKILLLGVEHDKNTYFHAVDEMLNIPNRLNINTFQVTIRDYDGTEYVTKDFAPHFTEGIEKGCSHFFPNYKKPLEELGAVVYGTLGNAQVYHCDAVACKEVIEKLWAQADQDLCVKTMDLQTPR